jgi:aspartyl-tRNA(Asn)/glutamyl-tRNA(Gln) amidotransferase subunit A
MPAILEEIRQTDEELAAWVCIDVENVLQQAALIDARLEAGEELPLAGKTVGIKDIIDVRGYPTAAGFEPFAERVAARSAPVVTLLRRAGALIVGKTATTQFAASDPAQTKNPWNFDCTPGGSSAGSAVAVSAHHVDLALGTQTGGSVLRPSAYCGIIGFKPGYGWTSTQGVVPFAMTLDTIGIHARTVADTASAYDAMARPELPRSGACAPVGPPRLAIWADALAHAGERMRAGVIDALEALAHEGAVIQHTVAPVSFDNLIAVHTIISRAESASAHSELIFAYPDDYAPRVRAMVETGMALPADVYVRAQQVRAQARQQIIDLWSPFDAIAIPTSQSAAPNRSTTGNHSLQAIATLLGLPSITLPIGFNPDYLPLGMQLIGTHPQGDVALLRVARWVEEQTPQLPRPPHGIQKNDKK